MPSASTWSIEQPEERTTQSAVLDNRFFFRKDWLLWLAGLTISIIPLVVIAWEKQYNNQAPAFWSNPELIFVAVSMSVAAIFELLARGKHSYSFTVAVITTLIIMLLIGAMCYGYLVGEKEIHGIFYPEKLWQPILIFSIAVFAVGSASFFNPKGRRISK